MKGGTAGEQRTFERGVCEPWPRLRGARHVQGTRAGGRACRGERQCWKGRGRDCERPPIADSMLRIYAAADGKPRAFPSEGVRL